MRGLYRFYLYTVFILLGIYATYTCVQLLSTLLRLTPLRSQYDSLPSSSDIVQAVTLALVSFVVVLLIGGLHYWLIRRNITQEAEAGTSAVRSFFLNITEGVAVALSLPTFGSALMSLAYGSSIGPSLAFALSTFVLAVLLELERRRIATPPLGASTIFLRIRTYGVQVVLLIALAIAWSSIVPPLVDGLFFGGRAQAEICTGGDQCSHANLFLLALAGLWFVAGWLFYGQLTSRDTSRALRFTLHGLGFAIGIGTLLVGLYNLFHVLLLLIFDKPVALNAVLGIYPQYNFVGLLTLGLLVTSMYHIWMQAGVNQGRLPTRASLRLIEIAVISVLAAATFWWGIGNLLYNTFALLLKFPQTPDRDSWLSAGAFALAGCASIVIEFYLQRKNRTEPEHAAGPRRAQVLALLAGGILTLSVAIATTLYIGLTTVLRAPIADWTQVLSFGLATLLVGLPLVGFYLYTALNEHQFGHQVKIVPASTPKPAPEQPQDSSQQAEITDIETILSQLLANQITRAEASEKLQSLMHINNAPEIHNAKSGSLL